MPERWHLTFVCSATSSPLANLGPFGHAQTVSRIWWLGLMRLHTEHSNEHANASGFTLLELLVATTIVVFLVSLISGSLHFTATVWERTKSSGDEAGSIATAQSFLRRQLADALPLGVANNRPKPLVAFAGEPNEMRFVSGTLGQASPDGPFLVKVSLGEIDNVRGLIVGWRSLHSDLKDWREDGEISRTMLLEGAKDLTFSYFGPREADPESSWQSRWEKRQHLPSLVRISVAGDNDKFAWPEFLASTFVTGRTNR